MSLATHAVALYLPVTRPAPVSRSASPGDSRRQTYPGTAGPS